MSLQSDTRVFNSYKGLFKIKYVIHDFFGKSLPRPIPLENVIMAAIISLPMYPITYIFDAKHPFLSTVIFSGVCSWIMSQFDLQGKFMPTFFKDIIAYVIRYKTTNLAGQKINKAKKYRANWILPEVID